MENRYLNVSAYRFVSLTKLATLGATLCKHCDKLGLLGTILLGWRKRTAANKLENLYQIFDIPNVVAAVERAQSTHEIRQRSRAAHVMVQRTVVEVAQEAIRVCGGRALLKQYPLERFLRDAQAASVMRPWTREIATEAAWESALRQARKANGTE